MPDFSTDGRGRRGPGNRYGGLGVPFLDRAIAGTVESRGALTGTGSGFWVLGSGFWDEQAVRGKSVVAAIDFHRTRLYPTDASPGERPERVVDVDPQGHSREVSHKAGNPDGTYEAGNQDYWREITEALAPAGAILLLGHGNGNANASHQ